MLPFLFQDFPLTPEMVSDAGKLASDHGGAGVWTLVIMVLLRWWWTAQKDRTGPSYLQNGSLERIASAIGEAVGRKVADELGTRLVGPLQRQAGALEEVAREMLDSRLCPFRPGDAEALIEQTRSKAKRLEDLKAEKLDLNE